MKKLNPNKRQNWKFCVGMLALVASTLFVSCEKNEEPLPQQLTAENEITGDYSTLNSTIVNTDNGIPQGIGALRAFIGDELQLLDDGTFNSSTMEGSWVKEENSLFLYPKDGVTINLEVQTQDDQTLNLLQKYDSYGDYASGIIAYTFIKKGSESSLAEDLLSSIEMWF